MSKCVSIDPTVSRSGTAIQPVVMPVRTVGTPIDPVVVLYTPGGAQYIAPDVVS